MWREMLILNPLTYTLLFAEVTDNLAGDKGLPSVVELFGVPVEEVVLLCSILPMILSSDLLMPRFTDSDEVIAELIPRKLRLLHCVGAPTA